jgi:hypothetical protein
MDALQFYEQLQQKYGGNIENMLEATRISVERSKFGASQM